MRVAIIGLGCISGVHYKAISRTDATLVAVCDNDERKLAAFRERTADPATPYTNYKEMIEKEHPDVVHICTPHYLHAEMVLYALRAGCNVLCEKPLCIREEDIAPILQAEKESGKKLGICLQNRYNESNREVVRLLGGQPARAAFGNVVWNRDASYYASGEWRGKWATEGGGVMINQALHTLDLVLWFMGTPKTVQADIATRRLAGVIEVEDTASALFRYEDGRMFNFYAATASGADFPVQVMLETADRKKITVANDLLSVNGEVVSFAQDIDHGGKHVWGDGHTALVADFYDAIENDRPFAIDGEQGAGVVRAILAMYRSKGEEVALTK